MEFLHCLLRHHFLEETSDGIANCLLFSQAIISTCNYVSQSIENNFSCYISMFRLNRLLIVCHQVVFMYLRVHKVQRLYEAKDIPMHQEVLFINDMMAEY